jgi:hypothetical protein
MPEVGAGVYEIIVDTAAGWFRVMCLDLGMTWLEQLAKLLDREASVTRDIPPW